MIHPVGPERSVFCNRTLNLRSVQTIGYDMDYTLIHYHPGEWEDSAFRHAVERLGALGWPIDGLVFEPEKFSLGLVFDLELGNLVKATRFGYVVKAQHGERILPFEEQRTVYRQAVVELSEPRFEFMNTLFELSRAALWTQFVARHDTKPLPGVRSYGDLYRAIDLELNQTHRVGTLKAEILADPERFVDLDPDLVQTLKDQRLAGKSLLLITNSDWHYTRRMMRYAFDRFCDPGETWRDLFDVVIVSANKPRFFVEEDPFFRVVDEDESLLLPHYGPLEQGQIYFGGNAHLVRASLGPDSVEPLYVGDHLFGDVHVSKEVLRWRTALIARELEAEITAAVRYETEMSELASLMAAKAALERQIAAIRMERTRAANAPKKGAVDAPAQIVVDQLSHEANLIDDQIAPLAKLSTQLGTKMWGPLMRAGNDKSLYARQVERYADVYTSRVSNLMAETPYAYLRAARGSLPHDPPLS